MGKYPSTLGRIEAVWNKLGGEEGVDRLLRGEIPVSEPTRSWREKDGVIYFSVTSYGTTGEEWARRLEGMGFYFVASIESILRSPDFKSTSGMTTEVAVLKGVLFGDNDRTTRVICAEAARRKLITPNAEIACLIRLKFTDAEIEAMGFRWIVAMHKPIRDFAYDPSLLGVGPHADGLWLLEYDHRPDDRWPSAYGFAFAVSQVVGAES